MVETIFADTLDLYIEDKHYQLIDVRTAAEYEVGHIKNAVSVPYESVKDYMERLQMEKIYIVYCERGVLSFDVARDLSEKGFMAVSVLGGIKAYHGKCLE
ncbi:MAG: rhodanese-like domain-containing protein [Clostridia bacterium]|nr:rhodanese-like domain-containing protein [Clostridia bacterium]